MIKMMGFVSIFGLMSGMAMAQTEHHLPVEDALNLLQKQIREDSLSKELVTPIGQISDPVRRAIEDRADKLISDTRRDIEDTRNELFEQISSGDRKSPNGVSFTRTIRSSAGGASAQISSSIYAGVLNNPTSRKIPNNGGSDVVESVILERSLPETHGEVGVVEPVFGSNNHMLPSNHGEVGVVEPVFGSNDHMLPSNHGEIGVVEPVFGSNDHMLPSNHGEIGVVEPVFGSNDHMLPSNHGQQGVVEPVSESGYYLIAKEGGKNHYIHRAGLEADETHNVFRVVGAARGDRFHPIEHPHWSKNPEAQAQNLITASREYYIREEEGDNIFYAYAPGGRRPDLASRRIDNDGLPARAGEEGDPVDDSDLVPLPQPPVKFNSSFTRGGDTGDRQPFAPVEEIYNPEIAPRNLPIDNGGLPARAGEEGDSVDDSDRVNSKQTIDAPSSKNGQNTRTSVDPYSREAAYKRKLDSEGVKDKVLLDAESENKPAKTAPGVIRAILHLDQKPKELNTKLAAIKKVNEARAVAAVSGEKSQAQVNRELQKGQAINLAIGGIPDASSKDKPVAFGTGVGYLNGETALAAGIHLRGGERVVAKAAVGSDLKFEAIGMTAGVSFAF